MKNRIFIFLLVISFAFGIISVSAEAFVLGDVDGDGDLPERMS